MVGDRVRGRRPEALTGTGPRGAPGVRIDIPPVRSELDDEPVDPRSVRINDDVEVPRRPRLPVIRARDGSSDRVRHAGTLQPGDRADEDRREAHRPGTTRRARRGAAISRPRTMATSSPRTSSSVQAGWRRRDPASVINRISSLSSAADARRCSGVTRRSASHWRLRAVVDVSSAAIVPQLWSTAGTSSAPDQSAPGPIPGAGGPGCAVRRATPPPREWRLAPARTNGPQRSSGWNASSGRRPAAGAAVTTRASWWPASPRDMGHHGWPSSSAGWSSRPSPGRPSPSWSWRTSSSPGRAGAADQPATSGGSVSMPKGRAARRVIRSSSRRATSGSGAG
jgi:hypothetical protein